jgi:hypothetical protein
VNAKAFDMVIPDSPDFPEEEWGQDWKELERDKNR